MIVTAVIPVDKRKSKVFLEEGFAFVLYRGKVERFGIEEGKELEEAVYRTTQKADLRERMRGEFKALIGKDHEELMRVKDGKTKANFYVKQQGELIQELIMIADMDDGSFSVMQLLGRFTLQDVQEITSEINK